MCTYVWNRLNINENHTICMGCDSQYNSHGHATLVEHNSFTTSARHNQLIQELTPCREHFSLTQRCLVVTQLEQLPNPRTSAHDPSPHVGYKHHTTNPDTTARRVAEGRRREANKRKRAISDDEEANDDQNTETANQLRVRQHVAAMGTVCAHI